MTKTLENLEDIKEDISRQGEKVVDAVNILFLDASSTCSGYSIMAVNFINKTAKMTSCGSLWLDKKDWENQVKYSYMFHAISNYFWIVEQIDYIVIEQYSINPKKMVGVQVLPELAGAIKTAAEENGLNLSSILPQTWRSQLGIKPTVTTDAKGKKKKDYKQPTKDKILEYYSIPEMSVSNITGNERATPSDLYDAIAIGMGWCSKFGLTVLESDEFKFNSHIGVLSE